MLQLLLERGYKMEEVKITTMDDKSEHLISWQSFCQRLGVKKNTDHIFYDLFRVYSEPGRFYHNFNHILDCLSCLQEVQSVLDNQDQVEMALWFHDYVYCIGAKDNEEKSANFAYQTCRELGLSDMFGQKVADLIIATKHSSTCLDLDIDTQTILDIDLISLGSRPSKFKKYCQAIREEYKNIPEQDYLNGRLDILWAFLARLPYQTEFFIKNYEKSAVNNIRKEIKRLEKKLKD